MSNDVTESYNDATEGYRRARVAELAAEAAARGELEKRYGKVWSTDEMSKDFTVMGFLAPLVAVIRIADGQKGSLEFQHSPRFYFNFSPHEGR